MAKATGPRYRVTFRRRRIGITDYDKRLALLKSNQCRMVVRRGSRSITVQFIAYKQEGDTIVSSANSRDVAELGYPAKANTPSAYLVGMLAGKKAHAKGITSAIADIGRQTPSKGSVLFAAIAGASAAGITVPVSPDVLPDEQRVSGDHLKTKTAIDATKQKILSIQPEKEARTP